MFGYIRACISGISGPIEPAGLARSCGLPLGAACGQSTGHFVPPATVVLRAVTTYQLDPRLNCWPDLPTAALSGRLDGTTLYLLFAQKPVVSVSSLAQEGEAGMYGITLKNPRCPHRLYRYKSSTSDEHERPYKDTPPSAITPLPPSHHLNNTSAAIPTIQSLRHLPSIPCCHRLPADRYPLRQQKSSSEASADSSVSPVQTRTPPLRVPSCAHRDLVDAELERPCYHRSYFSGFIGRLHILLRVLERTCRCGS